jgi:NADPH:quinone reductase-like Zn-dependent oxidoreductase
MAAPSPVPTEALWLDRPGGSFRLGPIEPGVLGPDELRIRARAIAVNPVDMMGGIARRVVLPWLRYPAVVGSDVAGEVVAVGSAVTRFRVGERVVGYAVGAEKTSNRAAEGGFQGLPVLREHLCAPIPDGTTFEEACVIPLACTTAAAGLFEAGQLALDSGRGGVVRDSQAVLVWGGSTSVGLNAIQLARLAGYTVITTASPKNFDLVRSVGASAAFDYKDPGAVPQIVERLAGQQLAGAIAIGAGSLRPVIRITARVAGRKRVASAYPTPGTAVRSSLARRQGVQVSAIWGGSPKDSPVGSLLWADILPSALADGTFQPKPDPFIVGHGLAAIPGALDRLRRGVSAQKLIVTL